MTFAQLSRHPSPFDAAGGVAQDRLEPGSCFLRAVEEAGPRVKPGVTGN